MAVKMVATAKSARRDYEILETFECGIALRGSEVKSLRESKVQLNDAYARLEGSELWLVGLNIAQYSRASTHVSAETTRKRKLLLHKYELERIATKVNVDRLQLVPMALYFKDSNVKLELGIGRGRKTVDKRQLIAKRDADREARRELAARTRRG
jgi:SsrA-binding protein